MTTLGTGRALNAAGAEPKGHCSTAPVQRQKLIFHRRLSAWRWVGTPSQAACAGCAYWGSVPAPKSDRRRAEEDCSNFATKRSFHFGPVHENGPSPAARPLPEAPYCVPPAWPPPAVPSHPGRSCCQRGPCGLRTAGNGAPADGPGAAAYPRLPGRRTAGHRDGLLPYRGGIRRSGSRFPRPDGSA